MYILIVANLRKKGNYFDFVLLVCGTIPLKPSKEELFLLNQLTQLYAPFFHPDNWAKVLTSEDAWMIILSLVIMEMLLSVDNAVVLAAQTRALPAVKDQKKALFYGLWGAYVFRFIAIGLGTFLIHLWQVKVLGALYLVYLSIHYFWKRNQADSSVEATSTKKQKNGRQLFWSVVLSIELMDIAFSIDSVLASLAVSQNPVIVLIGGLVGILCMRGIADLMTRLMEKIPELESMAYVLIFIIGLKLFLSIPAIDIEVPAVYFFGIVLGAIAITIVLHYVRLQHKKKTSD